MFREGLKNLSLFVSDRDFDAIDGKSEAFNDDVKKTEKSLFSDFELEVDDADWLATKSKLEVEKAGIERESVFQSNFNHFELEPEPEDWPITYKKYKNSKRRRIAFWWMSTGMILLAIVLGVLLMRNQDEPVNPVSIAQSNSSNHSDRQSSIEHVPESGHVKSNEDNNVDESTPPAEEVQTTHSNKHERIGSNNLKINSDQTKVHLAKANTSELTNRHTVKADPNKNEMDKLTQNSIQLMDPDLTDNKDGITGGLGTDEDVLEKENHPMESEQIDVKPNEEVPPMNTVPDQQTPIRAENEPKDSSSKVPPGPNNNHLFYLGMVNQVDITKSLLLNSNPERYNQIRKASDRRSSQYTFGFEFGSMGKKVMLNAGLQVTQINFNNRYNYSYRIYDSLPVYNTSGQIIGYFLSRARDTTMNSEEKVKITKIQLPLNVSFISQLNKNMDLMYGFGSILSYNVKAEGTKTLSPFNTQLYRYSAFANKERSFNVLPQLNLGLKLDIGKNWMIAGQVMSTIYGFSRFKPDMTVSDRPYSLGLNIKLMYKLK